MEIPNILYNTNVCQQLPPNANKSDAQTYKAEQVMKVAALIPVIGRIASFTGACMQLQDMHQRLVQTERLRDGAVIMLEMGSTIGLMGLAVLNPNGAAIVSGFVKSFSNMKALINHLENDASIQTLALDVFRTGSNAVYMWAMISGSPVFIAISLVAQGSENFIEGGSMLVKQWKAEEKDWVVVGLAAMQIGLGGMRGYEGASMGLKYGMTKIHQPEVCRLGCDGELATGELSQDQLDQVNTIYEDVGDSKFTEVHLDQKGNVTKAKLLTGECLVSEWDASASDKIVMTQNGYMNKAPISSEETVKFGGQIPLNWNRPSDGMLSTAAMESCSGKFDLSQGYYQYVDVNIVFDQEWFVTMTNQSLSDGIQNALMGQDDAAWMHFLNYNQEMVGQFFPLSYIVANQL